MFHIKSTKILLGILLLAVCLHAAFANAREKEVVQTIDVAKVWSGHPVGFALLTHGERQFVAFYDAERQMTVGSRTLDSDAWQFTRLPSKIGWDSHNYITMAIDDDGQIHLCGNMHCVPLIYFRTTRPLDATSFEQITAMIGRNEQRCTYPRFLRSAAGSEGRCAAGELLFVYRDGGSGNGCRYFNVYDLKSKAWRRLFDEPLFSGGGKMNAYFQGPVRDRQGVFHVCWVWRDTPDCATNHHLSYVRSKDLMHWQTSAGKPLKLPITIDNAEVVDPVPPGGGIINGNTKLGFDADGRVIVSYHKFDAAGNTQIYNARREPGGWKIYQATDWDYRWEFSGGGAIPFLVRVGPVTAGADGTLTQSCSNPKNGSGTWRLDPATLKPVGPAPPSDRLPKQITRLESTRPAWRSAAARTLAAVRIRPSATSSAGRRCRATATGPTTAKRPSRAYCGCTR